MSIYSKSFGSYHLSGAQGAAELTQHSFPNGRNNFRLQRREGNNEVGISNIQEDGRKFQESPRIVCDGGGDFGKVKTSNAVTLFSKIFIT